MTPVIDLDKGLKKLAAQGGCISQPVSRNPYVMPRPFDLASYEVSATTLVQ
jgi:hypothetical protein